MAEGEAGQGIAQENEEGQELDQEAEGKERKQAKRNYTQDELDRIVGKVRKNARYLGRKEAEAEFGGRRQEVQREEKVEPPKPPKKEDFEDYETFLSEKGKFEARQEALSVTEAARTKAEKEARERASAETRQRTEAEFKKRAQAFFKENPDAAQAIEDADDVMISQPMGESIQESELGPRILHYLVANPEEAERISGLASAAAQAREIGKIEARIEAKLKKKPDAEDKGDGEEEEGEEVKEGESAEAEARNPDGTFKSERKQSRKAPDPIEPVGGRGANTGKTPSDKDDIDTWMQKANAQARREAGGT